MCPLRYIILFLSAAVALVIMIWGIGSEDDEKLKELLKDESTVKREEAEHRRSAFDYLNGKYLYEKYKLYKLYLKNKQLAAQTQE